MDVLRISRALLLVSIALVSSFPARATTVASMNLAELTRRADRIVRGTVAEAIPGVVKLGGGEVSIVTYRIHVRDVFKGRVKDAKGIRYIDVRMFRGFHSPNTGAVRVASRISGIPELTKGEDCLLFVTAESAAGLSTTVGLGQGRYRITRVGGREEAVNAFDNANLLRGMEAGGLPARGPVPYQALTERIRRLVEASGR